MTTTNRIPDFRIAVSKQETRSDTIWTAMWQGKRIYLATDGTNPGRLDSDPWEYYLLDIQGAADDGVEISMGTENYGYPFKFPRPANCGGNPYSGMTGLQLQLLEEHCIKTGELAAPRRFRLRVGTQLYGPVVGLPSVEDIELPPPAELE